MIDYSALLFGMLQLAETFLSSFIAVSATLRYRHERESLPHGERSKTASRVICSFASAMYGAGESGDF